MVTPVVDQSVWDPAPPSCRATATLTTAYRANKAWQAACSSPARAKVVCDLRTPAPDWLQVRIQPSQSSLSTNCTSLHQVLQFDVRIEPRLASLVPGPRTAVTYIDCTVTDAMGYSAQAPVPPIFVVPRSMGIPSDIRRLPDNSSAIVTDPEGRVSFRLASAGNQSMALPADPAAPVWLELSVHPLLAQGRSWRQRVGSTWTMPSISALWGASCDSLDLPAFEDRRAWLGFHTPGRNASLSDLEDLYLASRQTDIAADTPQLAAFGVEPSAVACPPFCPGTGPSEWYRDTAPSDGSIIARVQWSVQYSCTCQGFATGDACMDASTAGTCAWGEAGDCQHCPSGALCPGGKSILPLPQHWTPPLAVVDNVGRLVSTRTVAEPSIVPCDAPNEDRCKGWTLSEPTTAVRCEEGYDPLSYGCRGCLSGYFPDGPNECTECPRVEGVTDRAVPVLRVVGVVLGVAVGLLLGPFCYIAWSISRITGSDSDVTTNAPDKTESRGLRQRLFKLNQQQRAAVSAATTQSGELVGFLLQLVMLLVQAARYLPASLPNWMRVPLDFLQVILFDFKAVHPSCLGSPPLQVQTIVLSLCLAMAVMLYASCIARTFSASDRLLQAARGTNAALLLMYPAVTVMALETVDCRMAEGSLRWWPNVYVECYGADHEGAAALAWIALLTVVLGFPVLTFTSLLHYRRRVGRIGGSDSPPMTGLASAWTYYTHTTMAPDHFHYFHLMSLSTLLVAIDTQYLRNELQDARVWVGWAIVVGVVCTGRIWLVLKEPPYAADKRWMVWPEVCVLVCLALLRTTLATIGPAKGFIGAVTMLWLLGTVAVIMVSFTWGLALAVRQVRGVDPKAARNGSQSKSLTLKASSSGNKHAGTGSSVAPRMARVAQLMHNRSILPRQTTTNGLPSPPKELSVSGGVKISCGQPITCQRL